MGVSIACCTSWYDGTCYGKIAHIACFASSFCQLGFQHPGRWVNRIKNVGFEKHWHISLKSVSSGVTLQTGKTSANWKLEEVKGLELKQLPKLCFIGPLICLKFCLRCPAILTQCCLHCLLLKPLRVHLCGEGVHLWWSRWCRCHRQWYSDTVAM